MGRHRWVCRRWPIMTGGNEWGQARLACPLNAATINGNVV